ncbi:MAG: threonyl-tRNA synthetase editing domain-containing protein, partial [Candidatus Bathyarchaeia archaeon]
MRILQLHSDFIEYKPIRKEIAIAEESDEKKHRLEELVVLFTCIEEGDDENIAVKAIEDLKEYLGKIGVSRILIYPYAHLSTDLAHPAEALRVLERMESFAKESGIETHRAPFGWCKQFSLSIKGHPLAEQLRIVSPEEIEKGEVVSKALEAEEKITSHWLILQP